MKNHYIGMNPDFRFRGEGHSRIEALSDAAFALAITLLLISQKVPGNFGELKWFVVDLIPFAMCITIIMLLWYEHFIYFLRYGFRNSRIVFFNSILLFLVLFYVYPLKFLANEMTNLTIMPFIVGSVKANQLATQMVSAREMPFLLIIYGLGASIIFMIFSLMYQYAYKQREALELSPLEIFDTRTRVFFNLLLGSIPVFSATIAVIAIVADSQTLGGLAGISYILYWPASPLFWKLRQKKRSKFMENYKNKKGKKAN